MHTRSSTNVNIKQEPHSVREDIICDICAEINKNDASKAPKICKGQQALAMHKARAHNIK